VIGAESLPDSERSVTWWLLRARERMEGLYHNMATEYATKGLEVCHNREQHEGADMERYFYTYQSVHILIILTVCVISYK